MQSLITFNLTQDGVSLPFTSISSPSHDASVMSLGTRATSIHSENMEESCHAEASTAGCVRLQVGELGVGARLWRLWLNHVESRHNYDFYVSKDIE